MTENEPLFYQVGRDTFDLYLAIYNQLSHILLIGNTRVRAFYIDFKVIQGKLLVNDGQQDSGWRSEHIQELPKILRELKNLGLVKRMPGNAFLRAKNILAKRGVNPKRLYRILWVDSPYFFDHEGKPLLSTSRQLLENLLSEDITIPEA